MELEELGVEGAGLSSCNPYCCKKTDREKKSSPQGGAIYLKCKFLGINLAKLLPILSIQITLIARSMIKVCSAIYKHKPVIHWWEGHGAVHAFCWWRGRGLVWPAQCSRAVRHRPCSVVVLHAHVGVS